MRRRQILLGGLAIAFGASSVAAQEAGAPRRIGVLGNLSPPDRTAGIWGIFLDELGERGWIDGRTARIEARWAEGRPERYAPLAAELVALDLDVIVALGGSQPTQALKARTSAIPIVMFGVSHPVEAGYVASLARPGGNVTGITNQLSDLVIKYAEVLREAVPDLQRMAVLWEPDNAGSRLGFADFERLAPQLRLAAISAPLRTDADVERAFDILIRERAQALWVHPTPIASRRRDEILRFALAQRLPTVTPIDVQLRAGYLISYGPDWTDMVRRAAYYVDRLLRGTKPEELPVEQPTRFRLGVNLVTARKIGLDLPPALLARADQVIE